MKKLNFKDLLFNLIAIVFVLGFFFVIYVVLNKVIPAANEKIAYLIVGALLSNTTSIVQYFFGSSSGSDKKTELLYNSTPVQQVLEKIEPTADNDEAKPTDTTDQPQS